MSAPALTLRRLPGEYAVARFPASADLRAVVADIVEHGVFLSVTRTPHEVSVVCPVDSVPSGAQVDGPWLALHAAGPMPFGLTGVVTSLVSPLSAAGCPVFVTSTYDGDVLMFPSAHGDRATAALLEAGHVIV